MALPHQSKIANKYAWQTFGITDTDLEYFKSVGKALDDVWRELQALSAGVRYPDVQASARFDNGGLYRISAAEARSFLDEFPVLASRYKLGSFIPAAGAASRQFELLKIVLTNTTLSSVHTPKDIVALAQACISDLRSQPSLSPSEQGQLKSLTTVVTQLERAWQVGFLEERFAFIDDLKKAMARAGQSYQEAVAREDVRTLFHFILDDQNGLGYRYLPKALLRFHTYTDPNGTRQNRTALEEHLRFTAALFSDLPEASLHVVISKEHENIIEMELKALFADPKVTAELNKYGFNESTLKVTWSFQEENTNAVALNAENEQLARDQQGHPMLRKAGHGALIVNLSAQKADGVWVQNIDNILYDNPPIRRLVRDYKQIMAAFALKLAEQNHDYIRQLQANAIPSVTLLNEIESYIAGPLTTRFQVGNYGEYDLPEKASALINILDRPIVVAGYVPLQPGQKGGGPFIIKKQFKNLVVLNSNTLEGSEFVNGQDNPLFYEGICFNPVNFFIFLKRYDGSKFNLLDFGDPSRCFLSNKSDTLGHPLKVFERAGLWNGGLANVIQVSIGLPLHTFGAVKDLAGPESFLSPLHQPYQGPLLTQLDYDREIVDKQLGQLLERG